MVVSKKEELVSVLVSKSNLEVISIFISSCSCVSSWSSTVTAAPFGSSSTVEEEVTSSGPLLTPSIARSAASEMEKSEEVSKKADVGRPPAALC